MIVFFDLDDTLLDHGAALRAAALKFREHFAAFEEVHPPEFVASWRDALDRYFERYRRGELTLAEQRRELRELFEAPLADSEADRRFDVCLREYEAAWRLFPDVLACLSRLRGGTLAVITNADSAQQRQKLAATRG